MSNITVYFPIILIYAILFTIFIFGLWLMYSINKEENEKEQKEENRRIFAELSKASVSENAVPAREVFKTLEDAGIKPCFLGDNLEQG